MNRWKKWNTLATHFILKSFVFLIVKFNSKKITEGHNVLSGKFSEKKYVIFSLLLKNDILISRFLSVSFIFLTVKIEKLLTSVKWRNFHWSIATKHEDRIKEFLFIQY